MADRYDVVVLGAGSGGYATALRAAQLGLTVGLVEKDKVGGTCLHRGCIPTKAILHAAEVADLARAGTQFGIHASIDKIDLAGVRGYADGVVGRLYKGLSSLISRRGISVISGEGRLGLIDGRPAVQVGDQALRADHVVLASGSYARSLPGVQVDGERVLTSDHALRLEQLPSSAIVLGGGVIGCEFASAWRSFGVEVTVVEALPRLLPAEDPAISAALERAFRKRKITVLTGAPVQEAIPASGGVRLTLPEG
ncbi:MAG: FAD-dependent oxidoreductase, partial [Chloroflexota bacterium]|nr:FAD-dependent oxidoreductase [Chloroflexota bacterium]